MWGHKNRPWRCSSPQILLIEHFVVKMNSAYSNYFHCINFHCDNYKCWNSYSGHSNYACVMMTNSRRISFLPYFITFLAICKILLKFCNFDCCWHGLLNSLYMWSGMLFIMKKKHNAYWFWVWSKTVENDRLVTSGWIYHKNFHHS